MNSSNQNEIELDFGLIQNLILQLFYFQKNLKYQIDLEHHYFSNEILFHHHYQAFYDGYLVMQKANTA